MTYKVGVLRKVLLLTHTFGTIIDIMYVPFLNLKQRFGDWTLSPSPFTL
jgi:hypothetical protein